ncbi:hypothetical protein Tco_0783699 [Tanacetum coccineum]
MQTGHDEVIVVPGSRSTFLPYFNSPSTQPRRVTITSQQAPFLGGENHKQITVAAVGITKTSKVQEQYSELEVELELILCTHKCLIEARELWQWMKVADKERKSKKRTKTTPKRQNGHGMEKRSKDKS